MSSAIDLEFGHGARAAPRAGAFCSPYHSPLGSPEIIIDYEEVRGGDLALPVREAQPVVSQAETLDETSSSACCCIPSRVFRSSTSMGGGSNIDHFKRNVSDQSTQTGQRSSRAEAQTPVASDPTSDPDPRNAISDSESEEPRMIGDFDGTASEFWKLFIGEAESHDKARIDTLNEGMGSALIFAGLFSAVLTAFVVDSKQNLKPSPADETVYYLRQHSTILSQISVQLSSIAPQVVIPATAPPPFSPSASDLRVNVFWFMALAFSLLAALLAILVQQWVRKYMHVFERYGDPLKSSRVRQYLNEGCERWHMPRVAEVVPGFLHISLFLFFAGLANSLLDINTKVALSTIVPIGFSGLLYIFTIFAPIIYPQSPYQNSFSGIFWYLFQKSCSRRFKHHGSDGQMKPVSTNMAQGQMELAMEETEARKDRDERAIRWMIDNLTGDAEMETFLLAMPGSFNTDWGTEVWERVGKHDESEDESQVTRPRMKPARRHPLTHAATRSHVPHSPNVHPHSTAAHIRENVVYELSTRIARSVEICKDHGRLSNNDSSWRKRARACIETTASLVCCANAKLAWFEGIPKLLGDIGSIEKIRELPPTGTDELFVVRWTCLSLMAVRPILEDNRDVQRKATGAMTSFATADDDDALATVRKINETLQNASDCLYRLYVALRETEDLTEVKEILHGHEPQISEMEQINIDDHLEQVDYRIFDMQNAIDFNSHHIISQFPGALDDFELNYEAPIPFGRFVEMSCDPHKLQFIRPVQTLKSICSPALTLRNILKGQEGGDAYRELLKNLEIFRFSRWHEDEMQRQLWRLQDLSDGGGLGFTVELFFLTLSQLLSTSLSNGPHSTLYTGTFKAITSDWNNHKDSLGTQNLLLIIARSHSREFVEGYPDYIVDEFLLLLGNIFERPAGRHVEEARQWFESFELNSPRRFRERMLRVLTQRGRARD